MRFIAEGPCAFSVSTPKTKDYIGKTVSLNSVIAAARVKIQLVVEKVANQTAKDLPKSLELFPVYSASTGYVLPKSETPTTCIASGYFVRLISGGTCTLSYQSPETSTYRASDIYYQTFEIVREPQSLDFNLPTSAKLNEKTLTLSAKASSAATVTFKTSDNTVCTVEGEKLNFLKAGNCEVTASQAGTATLSPISKTLSIQIIASDLKKARTIVCIKGAKKIKVKAVKPKCPKGYVKAR